MPRSTATSVKHTSELSREVDAVLSSFYGPQAQQLSRYFQRAPACLPLLIIPPGLDPKIVVSASRTYLDQGSSALKIVEPKNPLSLFNLTAFQKILTEAHTLKSILFLENIENVIKISELASLLYEKIISGDARVIASTNPLSYYRLIKTFPGYHKLVSVVHLDAPDVQIAEKSLQARKPILEKQWNARIGSASIATALRCSPYVVDHVCQPHAAEQVLEGCVARFPDKKKPVVSSESITRSIGHIAGSELFGPFWTEESKPLIGPFLAQVFPDQTSLHGLLEMYFYREWNRQGNGRPEALVIAGSPGTGKTEVARVIQGVTRGNPSRLLSFDLSLYQKREDLLRLIGNLDAHSHFIPGQLTEPVQFEGRRVIVFSHTEKAHQSVREMILHLLDEGIYSDFTGAPVRFGQCVIIFETQLGSPYINNPHFAQSQIEKHVTDTIRADFPPELLKRTNDLMILNKPSERYLAHVLESHFWKVDHLLISIDNESVRFLRDEILDGNSGLNGVIPVSYTHLTLPTNREV